MGKSLSPPSGRNSLFHYITNSSDGLSKSAQPFEHHTINCYGSLREAGVPTLDRIVEQNNVQVKRDSIGLNIDEDDTAKESLLPDANFRKFTVTPANDPFVKK